MDNVSFRAVVLLTLLAKQTEAEGFSRLRWGFGFLRRFLLMACVLRFARTTTITIGWVCLLSQLLLLVRHLLLEAMHLFLLACHLFLTANIVATSKALVTRSDFFYHAGHSRVLSDKPSSLRGFFVGWV